MKQPKHWYAFHWDCPLFESGNSNMSALSKQLYCKRGKSVIGDFRICSCGSCPRLKRFRKAIKEGKLPERPDLFQSELYKKLSPYVDDPLK